MIEQLLTWARAEERRNVAIPAIAYRIDGQRLGVLISDLSYDGCQIATAEQVAAGERITLVIFELGTEIEAVVRWAHSGKIGIQFADVAPAPSEAQEA